MFPGSGPCPKFDQMAPCHEHGVQGIGIEQDGQRASISREVVSQLKLSEKIRIIEGNHICLPLRIDANFT